MTIGIKSLVNYNSSKFSTWHHERLGLKAPAVDLDFIEYNANGFPKCLFELKHGNIRSINIGDPKIIAIQTLATGAKIPCFIVCYYLKDDADLQYPSCSQFFVIPINMRAKKIFKKLYPNKPAESGRWFSEQSFSHLIFYLREEPAPTIIQQSSTTISLHFQKPSVIKMKKVVY